MSVNLPLVMTAFVVLGVAGISIGTYVNLRSVQSGRGPSPTGIAIQAGTIAVVLLSVVVIGLIAIATAGLWAAIVLLIPILVVAIVILLGAVQGFRAGRHS